MLNYIFLSTMTWTVLILFYTIFLRQEKFFTYNRIFLLAGLFIGLIIPLIPQFTFVSVTPLSLITVSLPEIEISDRNIPATISPKFSLNYIFVLIYLLGFSYFIFNLLKSLLNLYLHYKRGETVYSENYKIVKIRGTIVAFSFFDMIFINEKLYNSKKKDEILLHESVHVRQGHSYDILFVEILKSVFWFNPIIHFYRSFISETHEYIADNNVIQNISKKTYGELLINQLQSGVQYKVANYFINSLIKNRIKMMYKTKSNKKWKYFLTIPTIALLLLFVNACNTGDNSTSMQSEEFSAPPKPPRPPKGEAYNSNRQKGKAFFTVEEMPRFPGCEDIASEEEKRACSNEKLMAYIYSNLTYPAEAQKKGIEGKVMVRFIVTKTGNVEDINLLKNIGAGCGDAVIKVLESMNEMEAKFIPGRQNGKKVDVYFTLPVTFKLAD